MFGRRYTSLLCTRTPRVASVEKEMLVLVGPLLPFTVYQVVAAGLPSWHALSTVKSE